MTGWIDVTLGEICDFKRGLTYSKKDEVESSSNAVFRANNIDLITNKITLEEIRYISDEIQIPADKKIRKGDILICTASGSKSHLGKVAIATSDIDMAYGGFMGAIRSKIQIHPNFLFNVLISPAFKAHLMALSSGANINNLTFKQIESFKVPLPSLPVQKAIVAKLDAAFASIEEAIAAAERNAENAKQLFQSYLSDVFERGGDGWVEKTLNQVCVVERGSSPRPIQKYFTDEADGVNWIKIGDTDEGGKYVYKTNQKITREGALKSRHVKSGDFILTNSMSYGRPYIMRTDGYIHDGWFVLRLNESLDAEYFFYLLSSPFAQKQFGELAAGSVVKNISGDLVKRTKLPIPSYAEQQKLAGDFLRLEEDSIKLRSLYERKVDLVRELKQSLLQQAFNGQLVDA